MKVSPALLAAIAATCFALTTPALASVRELSDDELDGISAGGFDVDIPSALAFRAAVEQAQAQSTANLSSKFVSAAGFLQDNIAAICSEKGDIISAAVKNINSGQFKGELAGYIDAVQRNLSVIATQEGAVLDSTIDNGNTMASAVMPENLFQENIGVIAAAQDVVNCAINNGNQAPSGTSATVETYFVDCLHAAKTIQVQVSQSGNQRNVGIFISKFGNIINSLIRNTNNQE